jgi:hypothetical protein
VLPSIHEAIPLLVINEFQAHALGIVSAASKTIVVSGQWSVVGGQSVLF